MQTPILITSTAAPSNSAVRWCGLWGNSNLSPWLTSEGAAQTPFPRPGKFVTWRVDIDTAPGAAASGKKWTWEMSINGTPHGTFKVEILETATSASVTLDLTGIVATDLGAIKLTPTNTPTAFNECRQSLVWEGTTSTDSVIFGSSAGAVLSSGVSWIGMGAMVGDGMVMPNAGTLDLLHIFAENAVSAGTQTCEFYKQSIGGALTATGVVVPLTGGAQSGVDNTHSFTYVQGDYVELRTTATGSATSTRIKFGARLTPTVNGESVVATRSYDSNLDTANRFYPLNGAIGLANAATEANGRNVAPIIFDIKKQTFGWIGAPGSGKSRTATLRKNGSSTALATTITTGTDGTNNSDVVTAAIGDVFGTLMSSSGAPSSTWFYVSYVLFIDPGGGGLTGASSVTLAGVTSSGAGALAIVGTSSKTLAGVTSAGIGALDIAGASSKTLAGVTNTGVGAIGNTGASSVTLAGVTSAGIGALAIAGASSKTLDGVVGSGVGALAIAAASTIILQGVTNVGVGVLASSDLEGTSSILLEGVVNTGFGFHGIQSEVTDPVERLIHLHALQGDPCVVCGDPDDGSYTFIFDPARWNQLNRRCDPRYHAHLDYTAILQKRSRALNEERMPDRRRVRDRR